MTGEKLLALRTFYDARSGPAEPFIFYSAYDGVGIGNFDPSGSDSDGRFIVHFAGDWKQELTVGRGNTSMELIELALAAGSGTLDFSDGSESGMVAALGF